MNTAGTEPKGVIYEGIAFQFCKIATATFIARQFTLPVAAFLCSMFFLLAYAHGKRDTRCFGRYPLIVAAFWLCVTAIWVWWTYFRSH